MIFVSRIASIFAIAALIAVSADASAAGRAKRGGSEGGVQSAQKQKGAKEREDAYQNALKSIANGKANPDPWAGAR